MNLADPLVSVIVPCYNCGPFLTDTLNSVLAQMYSNWECIIVDNASSDNSAAIAKGFIEKDNRFKYVFLERKGVSAARNTGVVASKGKYILPLDADDKIGKSYMELAVPVLEKDPGVKLVYCQAELFGDSSGMWNLSAYSIRNLLIGNILFCTSFFRKDDFNKTGGYDETLNIGLEDWDFWIKLLGQGGDVYKLPEVQFYYRIRKNSRNTSVIDEEKQIQIRKKIYESHIELYKKYFSSSDEVYALFLARSKNDARVNSSIISKLRQLFKS